MFKDQLFTNILGGSAEIGLWSFLACIFVALVLGAVLANIIMYRSNCTKGFAVTVALLPVIICTIVLLLSDNFGAGLAIFGVFSLVKFRSAAGEAKEITALFIAVAIGIACGSGYIGLAIFFAIIVIALFFLYSNVNIWEKQRVDDMYKLTLTYDKDNGEEDIEPAVLEIIKTCTERVEKKKTSVTQKKKETGIEIVYDVVLTSSQDELIRALLASGLKLHFTLERKEIAAAKNL